MELSPHSLALFALASLVMVLTPGPNMVYLISRALCQGTGAGMISLAGVVLGFTLHVLMAAFGLSAFFLAVPVAYDMLRYLGAAYLLWLAWQAVKPRAKSIFKPQRLPADSNLKLFSMGFLTNALNPKIAIFYLSIFTQFLEPSQGSVINQSLILGFIQISISATVNAGIVYSAALVYSFLNQRPSWAKAQRWLMASSLTALAAKMALEERR